MSDLGELKVSVLFWEDREQKGAAHDEVVDQVAGALTEVEHQVSLLGISGDLRELLDKLDEQRPQLVFNLCERFVDNDLFEARRRIRKKPAKAAESSGNESDTGGRGSQKTIEDRSNQDSQTKPAKDRG